MLSPCVRAIPKRHVRTGYAITYGGGTDIEFNLVREKEKGWERAAFFGFMKDWRSHHNADQEKCGPRFGKPLVDLLLLRGLPRKTFMTIICRVRALGCRSLGWLTLF